MLLFYPITVVQSRHNCPIVTSLAYDDIITLRRMLLSYPITAVQSRHHCPIVTSLAYDDIITLRRMLLSYPITAVLSRHHWTVPSSLPSIAITPPSTLPPCPDITAPPDVWLHVHTQTDRLSFCRIITSPRRRRKHLQQRKEDR